MKQVKTKLLDSEKTESGTIQVYNTNGKPYAQVMFSIQKNENSGTTTVETREVVISDLWGRKLFEINDNGLQGDPADYSNFAKKIIPEVSEFPLLQKELKKYI